MVFPFRFFSRSRHYKLWRMILLTGVCTVQYYIVCIVHLVEMQSHFILTMSHWSSGLPVCFPSQGTQVQNPRGVLMWNRDSPVSDVSLQPAIQLVAPPWKISQQDVKEYMKSLGRVCCTIFARARQLWDLFHRPLTYDTARRLACGQSYLR
jgi:hypothetical protein